MGLGCLEMRQMGVSMWIPQSYFLKIEVSDILSLNRKSKSQN